MSQVLVPPWKTLLKRKTDQHFAPSGSRETRRFYARAAGHRNRTQGRAHQNGRGAARLRRAGGALKRRPLNEAVALDV